MSKLTYYEAFHAVMLSGSMTAAATMMNTSQPNVSRSISRLEKQTGLKLFDRAPGRLIPTADGQALFEEVQRSFIGLRRLQEAAARIHKSGSGKLRFGVVQSLALTLIPKAVKIFSDAFPEVNLSIHSGHTGILTQWVREHSCDFAIVSHKDNSDESFESELLYTVDAVCVLPLKHPLANKGTITPKDLRGEKFITFAPGDPPRLLLDRIFIEAGIEISMTIETAHSPITCALVAQGVGVAVINPFVAHGFLSAGVVARPFVPAPRHNALMIYPKGKPRDRAVENFVAILKKLVSEDKARISESLHAPS